MSGNADVPLSGEVHAVEHDVSVTSMNLRGILAGGQGLAFAADNSSNELHNPFAHLAAHTRSH